MAGVSPPRCWFSCHSWPAGLTVMRTAPRPQADRLGQRRPTPKRGRPHHWARRRTDRNPNRTLRRLSPRGSMTPPRPAPSAWPRSAPEPIAGLGRQRRRPHPRRSRRPRRRLAGGGLLPGRERSWPPSRRTAPSCAPISASARPNRIGTTSTPPGSRAINPAPTPPRGWALPIPTSPTTTRCATGSPAGRRSSWAPAAPSHASSPRASTASTSTSSTPTSSGKSAGPPQAGPRMAEFVEAIARTAHVDLGRPAFLVFPQNGPLILQTLTRSQAERYLAAIDGIGVEDTFYFGDADENNPLDPQLDTLASIRPLPRRRQARARRRLPHRSGPPGRLLRARPGRRLRPLRGCAGARSGLAPAVVRVTVRNGGGSAPPRAPPSLCSLLRVVVRAEGAMHRCHDATHALADPYCALGPATGPLPLLHW